MKNKKLLALLLATALAALALIGCSSGGSSSSSSSASTADFKLVEEGKLTIGSDLDYKPMEYLEDNEPKGFDVEMMQEICKRIGLECNYLPPQNFDSLVTQVQAGTALDVAVSSMTITPEREEQIDFSDPYYDSNQAIVVLKGSDIKAKGDLEGAKTGAQSGTTGENWVWENFGKDSYTPYTMPTDGFSALRAKKIDAFVVDAPVAVGLVEQSPDEYSVVEQVPTGEQYGIGISKDNSALRDAINQALSDMKADGTLDKLNKKWLSTE